MPSTSYRVLDAGFGVAGASVRVGGRTLTTDGKGRAKVKLARGRYKATASKTNYVSASVRFRIR